MLSVCAIASACSKFESSHVIKYIVGRTMSKLCPSESHFKWDQHWNDPFLNKLRGDFKRGGTPH
jgi:hypothetical protein